MYVQTHMKGKENATESTSEVTEITKCEQTCTTQARVL